MVLSRIQESGGRLTTVRKTIIALLLTRELPLSIQDIVLETGIDEVSVYRTTAFLQSLGFLVEVMTPDGVRRFLLETDHHDHIMCVGCGHLAHVPCKGHVSIMHPDFTHVSEHSLMHYGTCAKCTR